MENLTPRQIALKWWNSLSLETRQEYANNYNGRLHQSLTGREIQIIYENR